MTIGQFLSEATNTLTGAGIDTARLDCLILLEDALKKNRASILAHIEDEIASDQLAQLNAWVDERKNHIPLAYIRGKVMFYGREFTVNKHVLTPRPETETIIDILKTLPGTDKRVKIADIGAGSGCVGITAALEIPNAEVDMYDISPEALAVAEQNSIQLHVRTDCSESNLLSSVQGAYDVILANLPYVPDGFPINAAAAHEPALALFSGPDGIDHYKVFWQQVSSLAKKPHYIITESLPSQHHTNATLARHAGFVLEQKQGLIQLFVVDSER